MNPHQVLRRPLVTEKSTIAREEQNVVTFAVDPKANKETRVRAFWVEAYRTQGWGRIGYFLQEMKDKEIVTEPTLSLMRAVALSLAGARSEALGEIEHVHGDFSEGAKRFLSSVLVSQYLASPAFEKAKPFEADLMPDQQSQPQAPPPPPPAPSAGPPRGTTDPSRPAFPPSPASC